MKKTLSILLAIVMAVGMAVPAFAVDAADGALERQSVTLISGSMA